MSRVYHVQIPQMLHTSLAPLLLQQQQQQQLQLQQLMVHIGQQHMQQNQAVFHAAYPPASREAAAREAAAQSRGFTRANSLPLAEQQEGRRPSSSQVCLTVSSLGLMLSVWVCGPCFRQARQTLWDVLNCILVESYGIFMTVSYHAHAADQKTPKSWIEVAVTEK